MRRSLLLLLALLLGFALAAARPVAAQAGEGASGDTEAVAINTRDGSDLFRFAFAVRKAMGDVVDDTNTAVAYARCESCRTVAISFQIVLAMGSPSVVTPQNVAVAVNEQCRLCDTFAGAYQFVVGTGGPVKLTAEGRRELARIRYELRRLGRSDLPIAELRLRVNALADRVREVLRTELVPMRPDDD